MFWKFSSSTHKTLLLALNPVHIQEPRSASLLNTITKRELTVPNLIHQNVRCVFVSAVQKGDVLLLRYIMSCVGRSVMSGAFQQGWQKFISDICLTLAGLVQKCRLSVDLLIGELSQPGIMTWHQRM